MGSFSYLSKECETSRIITSSMCPHISTAVTYIKSSLDSLKINGISIVTSGRYCHQ